MGEKETDPGIHSVEQNKLRNGINFSTRRKGKWQRGQFDLWNVLLGG